MESPSLQQGENSKQQQHQQHVQIKARTLFGSSNSLLEENQVQQSQLENVKRPVKFIRNNMLNQNSQGKINVSSQKPTLLKQSGLTFINQGQASSNLNPNLIQGQSPSVISMRPRNSVNGFSQNEQSDSSQQQQQQQQQPLQQQQQQVLIQQGKKDLPKEKKFLNSQQVYKSAEIPQTTTLDLLNSRKKLSLQNILELTKQQQISDIVRLSMRNEGLHIFEPDFPLTNIQILNLSSNFLINLMGLLKLKTLKELDIDFNFITDLNPLTQLENLYKLKANNNRIVTLKPLMKLPKLQILEIGSNQVSDFDKAIDHLQEVEQLQELVFKDNPATKNRFSYKYDVLWALKLTKLDNEAVNQKDYDLSKAFNLKKDKNTATQMQNSNEFKENGNHHNHNQIERPQTSHGNELSARDFSLKTKDLEKKLQEQEKKCAELTEMLNQANQDKEYLEEQNEINQIELNQMAIRIEQLEKINEDLEFESKFAADLQKQNLDLRRKVAAYEQTLLFKDCDENELKQQIYSLNKNLEDQEYEIRTLKENNCQLLKQINNQNNF